MSNGKAPACPFIRYSEFDIRHSEWLGLFPGVRGVTIMPLLLVIVAKIRFGAYIEGSESTHAQASGDRS